MCCTVSVSFPQNLQVGSPLNRPIVRRCFLTGACPVRIATTILSWHLLNLSRLSAGFPHGLLIKGLPCLWPVKFIQVQRWCFIVQALIASLTEHLGIQRAGSGPCKGRPDACLASLKSHINIQQRNTLLFSWHKLSDLTLFKCYISIHMAKKTLSLSVHCVQVLLLIQWLIRKFHTQSLATILNTMARV
jgi:hypothetical protein